MATLFEPAVAPRPSFKRWRTVGRIGVYASILANLAVHLLRFGNPWLWFHALAVATLAFAAMTAIRAGWRALWVNLAVVFLAIAVLQTKLGERVDQQFEPGYLSQPDEILGYSPRPHWSGHWREYVNHKLFFDVVVTTDENGWRISPPAPQARQSIVFFGCSYTFGHGLNDTETFPYQTGEKGGGKYKTYNMQPMVLGLTRC
jgi:hypothetical protein